MTPLDLSGFKRTLEYNQSSEHSVSCVYTTLVWIQRQVLWEHRLVHPLPKELVQQFKQPFNSVQKLIN